MEHHRGECRLAFPSPFEVFVSSGNRISDLGAAGKALVVILAMGLLGNGAMGCAKNTVEDYGGEKQMPAKSIEKVLEEHTDEWMSIPGVVGTAIGEYEGKPCIKVLVVENTDELTRKVPSQVEGYPVVIEETGEIRALESGHKMDGGPNPDR